MNEQNKKPIYKCAICNTPHDSIVGRAKCETKCIEKQKVEEERQKAQQAKIEREEDTKRINEMMDNLDRELRDYFKKNEVFQLSRRYYYLSSVLRNPFWI